MPRFGYACQSVLLNRSTNHSCQLKSATPDRLRALIQRNLDDLDAILRHNRDHGWLAFRIGSGLIPFASHAVNTLTWWDEFAAPLAAAGVFARQHGMRLSLHPGQYTILNSPDEGVRRAALAELDYSARVLETMGMDAAHKIIIHVGGVYGDKPAAAARFVTAVHTLPERIRSRLALEHEERGYSLADTLALSAQTGLPVVFDNLHHHLNPDAAPLEALLPAAFATWRAADGPPEVHFSSQAVGARPGTHAVEADPVEFHALVALCSRFGDFDLILEAKGKDAALQRALNGHKALPDKGAGERPGKVSTLL